MRVGIYFDLRNPPEWRRPWGRFYGETLELIEQAEAWGIDNVWVSEHHFFEDGYLPQTLTFASAIAARTQRVRIGTAVLLAALRPSIQTAEEATIVDLVSNGRLDLGLGAGYRLPEYEAFGQDLSRRYTLTDRAAREIRAWLADERFVPKPVQDPLPIWMGYQGPQGARRAGRLGEGLLSVQRELFEPYREGLAEGGHDPGSARMTGLLNIVLADDPEAAWPRMKEHLRYQLDSYRRYLVEGTGAPTPRPVDPDRWREAGANAKKGVLPQFQLLTADEAIAAVTDATAGLPVHGVHFWASIAGMPDDLVHRNVELLATRLQPALKGL
jgi:alkanesulfonate monooxygenase SsuD/methylene tetrahydromethanopterin reductase-like flavin-dependent oxidoreductase (luciferase family)